MTNKSKIVIISTLVIALIIASVILYNDYVMITNDVLKDKEDIQHEEILTYLVNNFLNYRTVVLIFVFFVFIYLLIGGFESSGSTKKQSVATRGKPISFNR